MEGTAGDTAGQAVFPFSFFLSRRQKEKPLFIESLYLLRVAQVSGQDSSKRPGGTGLGSWQACRLLDCP